MNDLQDRLAALRMSAGAPDAGAVAADLRRGRRALARRRTVRVGGLGALALAAGGTAIAVGNAQDGPSSGPSPSGVRLVDYTGKQLPGFTITKVPAGYVLQGASASVLDIAKPGDHTDLDSFVGKIVITVEDASPASGSGPRWNPQEWARVVRNRGGVVHYSCPDGSSGLVHVKARTGFPNPCPTGPGHSGGGASDTAGHDIEVDGSAAKITTNSEGAKYLRYTDGDRRVEIQVWPTLHLSDAQLRELADGVTVSASAELSRG